jgi:hypothetical protein
MQNGGPGFGGCFVGVAGKMGREGVAGKQGVREQGNEGADTPCRGESAFPRRGPIVLRSGNVPSAPGFPRFPRLSPVSPMLETG